MQKISVIIPVYNTAGYLVRCIDSVLQQSCKPFEILLIDDGSTDGSSHICDEYALRFPDLIRVLHQENHGAAAARNAGIELAQGSLLSFIDSDDYIDPEMYKELSRTIAVENVDMAACEMLVESSETERYCRAADTKGLMVWTAEQALIELCSYRYLYVSFCNALFKKTTIGSLRFPEGQRCEDYALLYQVIGSCSKVAYLPVPFYHYVQKPESCSRTKSISLAPMDISFQQLSYFESRFPAISWAAKSDCVFSHMGIYTSYIRNGVNCPNSLLKKLQSVCRTYLRFALKNASIPFIKKVQAITFCFFPSAYEFVIKRTEHR